ncbi:hypothetical protein BDQ17DRAFT_1364779 [Cyathus striatus]|nr:hypothetical protein BDQ17DRAFT_1364779 [Cyathus striatus]
MQGNMLALTQTSYHWLIIVPSSKMWIRRLLKKLPLKELPDQLRAKPGTRWQPPRFVFGTPVDSAEQLFKLAKDNDFLGIDPKLENPDPEDVNSMDLKKTLQKLDKKLRKKLGIHCHPTYSVAHDVPGVILVFLTSYDENYPRPPDELSQSIQELLKLEEPLMWYLDGPMDTWDYGTYGYRVIGSSKQKNLA